LALVALACGSTEPPHTATTSRALVQSEPVGTLPGAIAVSPDGAAMYEIPLEVPAWRGGVTPTLALSYSSGAENGWLGVGWTLRGLSSISRCPSTIARDGEARSVRFDSIDRLCL